MDTQDSLQILKTGDMVTGDLDMGANRVTEVAKPTAPQDAVTKGYADAVTQQCILISRDTMTGVLTVNTASITGRVAINAATDVAITQIENRGISVSSSPVHYVVISTFVHFFWRVAKLYIVLNFGVYLIRKNNVYIFSKHSMVVILDFQNGGYYFFIYLPLLQLILILGCDFWCQNNLAIGTSAGGPDVDIELRDAPPAGGIRLRRNTERFHLRVNDSGKLEFQMWMEMLNFQRCM